MAGQVATSSSAAWPMTVSAIRPVFQSDFLTQDRHERTGRGFRPRATVDIVHALMLGDHGEMSVPARHIAEAVALERTRWPVAR